jgi:hypothetical protein
MTDALAADRETPPAAGRAPIHRVAVGVMLAEAVTFWIAACLHLGVRIPLGFAVLAEPTIFPATVVETTCGLALALAAATVIGGSRWGWAAAVGAHLLSIGGVLLGMAALAAGRGPRTASNDAYHLTIVTALALGLILLATPMARHALNRAR